MHQTIKCNANCGQLPRRPRHQCTNSKGKQKGKQKGFSLPEMMVTIVLAALFLNTIAEALTPALAFFGKQDTAAKFADLRLAIESAYKDDAKLVDAAPGAVFTVSGGTISPVAPNATGRCVTGANTFTPIARYLPSSAAVSAADGFGQGMCVYITTRQSWTVNGLTYPYHTIAVVSPGYDGAVDATTALSAAGVLTLGGDDKGIVIDGRKLVGDQVDAAMGQIQRASTALTSYFVTRYQSNPSRDMGVDYFARTNRAGVATGEFDSTGSMPSTGGAAVAITNNSAHTVLGLSVADVTDPWGGTLLLDNSSDAVRNPENSSVSMRSPGYTARISTTLPNGEVLVRTVVGAY
jgi:prepilin-type N-terminal cleavage/methylation domain-containing protein